MLMQYMHIIVEFQRILCEAESCRQLLVCRIISKNIEFHKQNKKVITMLCVCLLEYGNDMCSVTTSYRRGGPAQD